MAWKAALLASKEKIFINILCRNAIELECDEQIELLTPSSRFDYDAKNRRWQISERCSSGFDRMNAGVNYVNTLLSKIWVQSLPADLGEEFMSVVILTQVKPGWSGLDRTGQCPTVQRSYKLLILALVGIMMDIGWILLKCYECHDEIFLLWP